MAFDPAYPQKLLGGPLKASGSSVPLASTKPLGKPLKAQDMLYGGLFGLSGTVKYKNTPTNTPVHRKVWLFREPDMRPIATTWSDATTGAYEFRYIAGGYKYTVVSFDYTQNYRAVIADNLPPTPL